MKPRSPVLGYNHNVRYAGRLWHVQTEDSGVQNPHIFTHLFSEGTILATKRIDYDPTSDTGVVQKLMQAQHKLMLRELKQGQFDDKITRFFGTPVVKEPEESTDPGARPASQEFDIDLKTDPSIPEIPIAPPQQAQRPAPSSTSLPRVPRPGQVPVPQRPNLTPSRPAVSVAAQRSPQPRPVTGIPRQPVAQPYGGSKPTAEGVVVARPAVIVGESQNTAQGTAPRSPQTQSRQRRPTPPPPQASPAHAVEPTSSKTPTSDNIFGGDLISEKSLDEVILAYLSEDLNDK
jgi:hypothetical protein